MGRVGGALSVLQFAQTGSNFSVRACMRLADKASVLCLAQLVLHVFFAAVLITAGVQTHEGVLNECYVATVSLIFKVGGVVLVVSAVKQDNRHALMLGNLVELYLSIAPLASNSYYVDRIDHLSIKIASVSYAKRGTSKIQVRSKFYGAL